MMGGDSGDTDVPINNNHGDQFDHSGKGMHGT